MKEKTQKLELIAIEKLTKDENHPRLKTGDIKSLENSLKREGILNPITVIKVSKDTYYIIDGYRRVEAGKKIGLETIPCNVHTDYDPDPAESAHQSFVLNMERNQLNEIEIAHHIRKMKDEFNYSHTDLGMMGYGSKSSISKQLNLLDLPKEVQELIADSKLTKAHGEHLLKLGDDHEKIKKTASLAVKNDWSAETTRKIISKHLSRNNKKLDKKKISSQEVPGVYFKNAKDMSELPDEAVECIMTSPPYNIGMEFEKGVSFEEHIDNIKEVMSECARVLIPGGVMAINVANIINFKGIHGKNKTSEIKPMANVYQGILKKHGVYLKDEIVWIKDSIPFGQDQSACYNEKTNHTEYRIISRHEMVLIFRKKGERPVPSEDIVQDSILNKEEWKVYAPSVWRINHIRKADGHPAMFPEELASRIIKMYSYIGETILDPFLGSGTTIKVARGLDREGVGYEKELQYKETIMKKLGIPKEASETEGVADCSSRILAELEADQPTKPEVEANQPAEPEVEVMRSEGMVEPAQKILSENQKEAETV